MSAPESNDDFLRRLSVEFTAERWDAAFQIMHPIFQKFMKEISPGRTREIAEAMGRTPGIAPDDPSLVGYAYSQAAAEGVLVAVAHWIATQETPPPDAS
jgi:hypothetical protein